MPLPFLAAAGLISGGIQMFNGMKQKKEAQRAIDNYDRQDLVNPAEAISVSTAGSDLMKEESARSLATGVNALQAGGVRALMGGLPKMMAQNTRTNREAQKYIDDKIDMKSKLVADYDFRNQATMEEREKADLAGLGQQLETGRQNMFSGMRGMFNGVASGLSAIPGADIADPTSAAAGAINPFSGPNNNGLNAIGAIPNFTGGDLNYLDNRSAPASSSYNATFGW